MLIKRVIVCCMLPLYACQVPESESQYLPTWHGPTSMEDLWKQRWVFVLRTGRQRDIEKFMREYGEFISLADTNSRGENALMLAVAANNTDTTRYLLELACSRFPGYVNFADSEGTTPLMIAVRQGYVPMIDLLKEFGANPQFTLK